LSATEDLTNDYSREPVPDHQLVSGWKVALVVFGIGFTLPIYYLGSELGLRLGLERAFYAFFGGGILLGVLAAATAYVGARTRLSSYMIIEFSFGRYGAKFVNLIMAAGLLGYYATTADIFGQAIGDVVFQMTGISGGRALYALAGSAVMTLTAIFGFNAIKRLANFSVPIVGIFMSYVIYLALQKSSWGQVMGFPGQPGASLGLAVSTVIGSCVQGAVLMPDLSRFARSGVDGIKAAAGSAFGYPVIFLGAAIATIATGNKDIMMIMITLGVMVLALFTIAFSTWMTNTINLYSTSLTLATVFTAVKDWKLTLGASILATALAMIGIKEHVTTFFLALGIMVPPIAGIYLVDFFVFSARTYDMALLKVRKSVNPAAFAAWGLSSLVGYLASMDKIHLTSVAAMDALLSAGVMYYLFSKLVPAAIANPETADASQKS
jgi:cytosine permease